MKLRTTRLLVATAVGLFSQIYTIRQVTQADINKKIKTTDLQDQKTSRLENKKSHFVHPSMPIFSPTSVDITGLPKDRLVLCLFNNVYDKSEFSKKVQRNIDDHVYYRGSKRPLGATGYPPNEIEVKRFLEDQKGYIDYLGAVEFKMDFSKSFIDTKQYDDDHKTTSTPGVRTAKECIEQLRQEVLLENLVVDTLTMAFELGPNDRLECKNVNWPATNIKVCNHSLDLFTEFYIRKSIHEIGSILSNKGAERDALLQSIVDTYECSMEGSFNFDQEHHKKDIKRSNATQQWIKERYASSNDSMYKPMMSDSEHSAYISKRECENQIKKEKFEKWLSSRPQKNSSSISNSLDKPAAQSSWSIWSMFWGESNTPKAQADEPKPPTCH